MFDFTNLTDLNLSSAEQEAIQTIFSKSKVNTTAWACTPQQFLENFVRCIKVAIPCNAVPSDFAAAGILESGWFSTGVLFGVKSTAIQTVNGQTQTDNTDEVVNGKIQATKGSFFIGTIQQQSANYYAYLARRKPGTQKFLPADRVGFINYLQDPTVLALDGSPSGAYSTAGQAYVNSILAVVSSNNLDAFDHA